METFLVLNVGLKNKFLPLTIRTLKRRLIKYIVKRNGNAYMREYRERKKADETSAKTKHNAYMREYRKEKKADESRKGKFNKNNPSLECEVEEQSSTSNNSQNSECEVKKPSFTSSNNQYSECDIEKQSPTSNNNKITECDVEKQNDSSLREYKKEKMAHKISAKTKHNAYIREYREKKS